MTRRNALRGATLLGLAVLFWAAGGGTAAAMSETGTIMGTVVEATSGMPLAGATVSLTPGGRSTTTDSDGAFMLSGVAPGVYTVTCILGGYQREDKSGVKVEPGGRVTVNFRLVPVHPEAKPEQVRMKEGAEKVKESEPLGRKMAFEAAEAPPLPRAFPRVMLSAPTTVEGAVWDQEGEQGGEFNTESYDTVRENPFVATVENPLSTFSIDVDTASYANVRRFLNMGRLPPKDAVRIEEFVNYFTYDYPEPQGDAPFSISTELSTAPWNPAHKLVLIGIQGKKFRMENLPPANLVFLIDVSGSMRTPKKLPLLKKAFSLLARQLRAKDRVAIVVYAGAAGLVLPSTPGNETQKILSALEALHAGGSTAGGAGIELAYKVAQENFIKGGNNRVILATDGDFNVGASSDAEMERLIEEKRKLGVFLTVLGFGMGNYKDSKLERLADKGNGNYGYIDTMLEARKMLVSQLGGTLFTIAKDVKIQVEFNPVKVKGYRLIGYENRLLRKEEFDDDTKDAGELGAGHSVTALYEIIPAGSKEELPRSPKLKYQETKLKPSAASSDELMTVKLRYKKPDSDTSTLIEHPVRDKEVAFENTSENFRFASAVVEFCLLLRDSEFKGNASIASLTTRAKRALGPDNEGYRAEFLELVSKAAKLLNATPEK